MALLPDDGAALRAAGAQEALKLLRHSVSLATAGEEGEDSYVADLLALMQQAEARVQGRGGHGEL
jgi:hypothetical protein